MQKDKKYYDDFFTKYNVDIHDNPARFNAVSKLLNGKVLDVACGTGTLSKYYSGDYVGVDISDIAIEKAIKERRDDSIFEISDFTKICRLPSSDFDCVYLGEFLEHIENDDIVFQNISAQLKPNGKIIVSVPNDNKIPDESHCRFFTVPQIKRDYSKYGKITFHNWSGFSSRILFAIEPNEKTKNDISLVMVVKNEEKGLEKSILSALPLVDNVVIYVDDKSKDLTDSIAKRYADEWQFFTWQNDFSKARNFAARNVKTKWILFLDGHEFIKDYGNIHEHLKKDVDGVFVNIEMESKLKFVYPRIYRSHLKFKNAVHNLVECKTRAIDLKFLIVHDREGGQSEEAIEIRNKQREEMMPKELKKQIKRNPKSARAYFHLANFYMMRKNIDGAMHNYKKAIKYEKSMDEKYLCLLHLGSLHLAKGHSVRALYKFKQADELEPNRWESARVLGGFYFIQGNYKKALDYLVQALTPNKRAYSYQPMKMNKVEIWDMLGSGFAKLDQNQKAIVAWKRAFELTKNKNQKKLFKQKIDLVKTLLPKK